MTVQLIILIVWRISVCASKSVISGSAVLMMISIGITPVSVIIGVGIHGTLLTGGTHGAATGIRGALDGIAGILGTTLMDGIHGTLLLFVYLVQQLSSPDPAHLRTARVSDTHHLFKTLLQAM
jgi:hypothetical protein